MYPAVGVPGAVHGDPLILDQPPHPNGRPYLAVNMVVSVDGRATLGPDGTATGLGSPTDARLMRRLRAEADAVLHGAATVRADRARPRVPSDLAAVRVQRGQPAQPLGAVITASGNLDPESPYFRGATLEWPRLVYSASNQAEALARSGVDVWVAPAGELDIGAMLDDLARRGVRRVICEGGPTLNGLLLRAGAVDDLFLTLAPHLLGGHNPLTLVTGDELNGIQPELRSIYQRENELFLRYGVHSRS